MALPLSQDEKESRSPKYIDERVDAPQVLVSEPNQYVHLLRMADAHFLNNFLEYVKHFNVDLYLAGSVVENKLYGAKSTYNDVDTALVGNFSNLHELFDDLVVVRNMAEQKRSRKNTSLFETVFGQAFTDNYKHIDLVFQSEFDNIAHKRYVNSPILGEGTLRVKQPIADLFGFGMKPYHFSAVIKEELEE